ncbi:SusC/RagA family TonB-linked outer membrane protein [uncultured Roseivirga sp.]|uniref:SusC/RagA family TonB-linked outer membrane protein n=1 Tax=uncultured Roseivirga sp. TaxID=543088 RepID=UPI000D7A17EA|nr:SusC/RagA family TonB-linked outer membrane protein [uncultured Roseivirga sp.]PWL27541.1 MAG: SusC/RagA family protein [Roseivirga sp. XM-24bin3]
MKHFLLSFMALVLVISQASAQQRTVTGKVTTAEDGLAFPGVSVFVKGTTVGVITDSNGNYSLSIPSEAETLVFSFIGYTSQEKEIGNNSVINVAMTPDVTELGEVVVTAFGTTTKRDFTGSASSIASEDLKLRPVTNPIAAIEGNATGVQFINSSGAPGSSPNLVIRGVGTLNGGSTSPLFIVDGVQFEGTLSLINQEDIESFTILKDAASTSLYGSRAANGVVIITTKSGRKGEAMQVNFSTQTGWMSPAIEQYEATNPKQYYEVMWEAYKNSLSVADPAAQASANIYNRLGYNPFNVPNDQIVGTDGRINPNAEVRYPALDWFDVLQRQGTRQNHNLSITGGSENSSIFFSTGYLKEEGYVIESDFERVTTRLKADFTPKEWLTIGGNINLSLSDQGGVGGAGSGSIVNPFGFAKNMGAIYPVYIIDDATGQIVRDAAGNPLYDRGEGYSQYGISPRPQSPGRHAIEEAYLNDIFDRENAYGFRTYVDIDIPKIEGLSLRVTYGRDYQERTLKDYENAEVGDGQPTARYAETRSRRIVENFNQILTYKTSINYDHNLDITVGHESFDRNFSGNNTFATTQVAEGIYEFDNFSVPVSIGGSTTDKTLEGYLARINYNYRNKYYLSLSGRRDGSSVFSEDVRWGNFYSVGASWRLSEESFMSNVGFVDDLKIRASYGEVGNDNLGDYYISQARYQLTSNAGNPAISLSDLGNQALTWETIENFDVAVEFSLFNNLIDGSVEYYRRNSSDLLYNVPIAISNGLNSIPDNIADMYNDGLEISLTGHILQDREGLSWDITALGTTLNNQITNIPDPFQNGSKRWDVGRSRYDFYIYHTAGVDPLTGDQLYYKFEDDPETGNGVPVLDSEGNQVTTNDWAEANRAFTGDSSIPDFIGSVSNRLNYKGFSLSILVAFSSGGKILDGGYSAMMGSGDFGESHHVDQLNAWKQPGDITSVPRLENGSAEQVQTQSTRFLTDASWISLRNVSLSYTFDDSMVNRLGLSNLNVFISGDNLWFSAARKGLNPQYSLAGTGSGNDYNPNKIFSVGLNLGL